MSKKRHTRKVIQIPGQNGAIPQAMRERVDPTIAPMGAAFTGEHADKIMTAIRDGIQQIMAKFGIQGYSVSMVMPLVEWRDGIPIPGETSTKSDFVITNGRSSGFCGRMGDPKSMEAAKAAMQSLLPAIWEGAWGMTMQTNPPGETAPANLPDVPPATDAPAEPA